MQPRNAAANRSLRITQFILLFFGFIVTTIALFDEEGFRSTPDQAKALVVGIVVLTLGLIPAVRRVRAAAGSSTSAYLPGVSACRGLASTIGESAVHRCLQLHAIHRLPETANQPSKKRRFK